MSNEYYIKVYDLIFSLVKSNLTGTDQWVDDVEDININGEFEVRDLIGKIVGCKSDDYKTQIIKMNRVEL